MATAVRDVHYTYTEYLALEAESSVRHEYWEGEIYAMAGGSPDHAALSAQIIHLLASRVPRGCRVYTSDLRVRIASRGVGTYADAAVVCGGIEHPLDDSQAAANPILVVEVTSPSTERYDRGTKLAHYRAAPSMRAVVLVSHRHRCLTLHERGAEDSWSVTEAGSGEAVTIAALGLSLATDEVYHPEFAGSP